MKVQLAKNFSDIFMPLFVLQKIFLLQKFNITNYELSFNSKIYYIVSFIILAIFKCALYYLMYVSFAQYFSIDVKFIYLTLYAFYMSNFVVQIIFNAYSGVSNIGLLKKMYDVDKLLYSEEDTKRVKMLVWGSCFGYSAAFVCLVTVKLLFDHYWNYSRAMFIGLLIADDIEMIYGISIVCFLAIKMRRWYTEVGRTGRLTVNEELNAGTMYVLFQTMISAMALFQKAFQVAIFFHFIVSFVQFLMYFEILIIWIKRGVRSEAEVYSLQSHMLGVALWISKALVLEAALCVTCDRMYRNTREATRALTACLHRGDESKLAKNIRREYQVNFGTVSACGTFEVTAALPLRFAGVVATYAVVLLQFALNK